MRGKQAILAILSMALVAAGFGIWFKCQMTDQVLELFGPASAQCVTSASQVTYLELPGSNGVSLTNQDEITVLSDTLFNGTSWLDISDAVGLSHLRHALLQDVSYDWHATPGSLPCWQHALQFVGDQERTTLLFDLDQRYVFILEQGQQGVLHAKITQGLREYLTGLTQTKPL